MNKSVTVLFVSLIFFQVVFSLSTSAPARAASPSADSKTSELEDEVHLQKNTLAPPLMGAGLSEGLAFGQALSLLDASFEPGHWGELAFQSEGERSFRLQSRDLKNPAGFFWLFEKPMDLRNRWVEVVYSGMAVPSQVTLNFDSRMPRTDGRFVLPLANSFEPKSGYFKLPDRLPFSKIRKLSFVFDPRYGKDVEMMLLDLKVLPEGADPLK